MRPIPVVGAVICISLAMIGWWAIEPSVSLRVVPSAGDVENEDESRPVPPREQIEGEEVADASWVEALESEGRVKLVREIKGEQKVVTVETLGKVPERELNEHISISKTIYEGTLGQLRMARESGAPPSKVATLEYDAIERGIYLDAVRSGDYQTYVPGDGSKVWGASNERYTALYSGIGVRSVGSKPTSMELVVVIDYDRHPKYRDARDRLWDAWFVDASDAAEEFNGSVSFEDRKKAVTNPRSPGKGRAGRLFRIIKQNGGRFRVARDYTVYPIHRRELLGK